MTLEEIQTAVLAGKTVHWSTDSYVVRCDELGQWLIICTLNQNTIGLTWRDGVTMNGQESEFFIAEHDQAVVTNMIRHCGLRKLVDSVAIGVQELLDEGYFKNESGEMDENDARTAMANLSSNLY